MLHTSPTLHNKKIYRKNKKLKAKNVYGMYMYNGIQINLCGVYLHKDKKIY